MHQRKTLKIASYELCALAVIAFVADHVGFYFYTDNLWFRVFRLFALVWFFPAGYNSAWRSSWRVYAGIAILTIMDAWIFTTWWPISAIATLVIARALVDPVMDFALKSKTRFWGVQALLVLLIMPTSDYLEYGTIALLFAEAGWLVRHRGRMAADIVSLPHFFVFATAIFLAFSQYTFGFSAPQLAFVVASTGGAAWLMYHFDGLVREDLRRRRAEKDDLARRVVKFLAHRSLEIYVVHLAIFKLMIVWANR